MKSDLANNAEMFTPEKDVIKTLEDGRTIQVAVKGVPMPVSQAKELDLIKDSGKKTTAPEENKSAAPAENKSAAKPKSKK